MRSMRPGTPMVVHCDSDAARALRVTKAVHQCGARAIAWPRIEAETFDVLLAAVEKPLHAQQAARAALRHASDRRIRAIAYGPGVPSWTAVEQCELLLCGATRLLDCEAGEFDASLRREISEALEEAAAAIAERAALQKVLLGIGFVAESAQALQVFRLVSRLAQLSDVPVLISGESGTGKELIAKALHHMDSRRARAPFIALNCAAISPGLAESELFGHVRGAFTGADRSRKGLLRAASGGILFLDEVGEMSLELQAKMLRVLQDGRIVSVGDEHAVTADARIVAATNRDLGEMVAEGRFRDDLYHRLNVVPVRIPPLRERPEDIDALLEHFLRKHGGLGPAPCTASGEFRAALRHLSLPGNARQLENLVRQVLVSKRDAAPLALTDLPVDVWREIRARSAADSMPAPATPASFVEDVLTVHRWKLSDSLEHCERKMIDAALVRTRGNRTKAAQLLGITPRSMYNKLRRSPP